MRLSWRAKSSHLLFLLRKTKGGSTPLRSGRHDIPLEILGYTNPGNCFSRLLENAPKQRSAFKISTSQHLADHALQIGGFRDPEQHGMILGLAPFLQDAHLAMHIAGRLQEHLQELSFRDVE